uniref:Acyl carrier protein n=1 Tax=Bangiopsis subsimplex TaxID=139980 RepID=A0A1C9CCQ6_9RHOD|nr:acyl carrier protein [Bangiopsis subsimplex]AOM66159.1 acyl carrier protein [Bangiopsis subsimplex]ARO90481.1 acyl carrier protein [Bangiopsis subsimplex]
MEEKEIFEKVQKIVAHQLGIEKSQVTETSSFTDDLGADSLDTLELVMSIEEEFNLEIPDTNAEEITTPGEAVSFIKEKLEAK